MTTLTAPRHVDTVGGPACCPASGLAFDVSEESARALDNGAALGHSADPGAYVRLDDSGRRSLALMVENLHCAACIRKIEGALGDLPGVEEARVNMTTRRLAVTWRGGDTDGLAIVQTMASLGYPSAPYDAGKLADSSDDADKRLLAAMAVAGFAAGNIMLLSVSVWAGAFTDMGPATRDLFHWISALIAIPAVAYAGQPFFRSAWAALRNRSLNMDVPISLAVLLAVGVSIYATSVGRDHAYFDASVTLLFFLLVGRYLDRRARTKARSAAANLLALNASAAVVIDADGRERSMPPEQVEPGMTVLVATGARVPVDGVVESGTSETDNSLVTGESLPKPVAPGDAVFAGTLNLGGPLRLTVEAAAGDTLLAEIVRLMEVAEQGRAKYVRLAERAARIYAPAVHVLAAATFVGWLMLTASGWENALMAAVAVLIITCPCALGLAVPVVQVVASGFLLGRGVMVKTADGMERLAACDTVVFDKTGTLTRGHPELIERPDPADLDLAAALAVNSRHPLSRAVVRAIGGREPIQAEAVSETPGMGVSGHVQGHDLRLGSRQWCGIDDNLPGDDGDGAALELWMTGTGRAPVRFRFADPLRDDAASTIESLRAAGFHLELLSGDREPAVAAAAADVGIEHWRSACLPAEKVERIEALRAEGRKVLMVGDGLNDAPALASGFASLSPTTAADVSQTAADLLFQGQRLAAVVAAIRVSRFADKLVKQNFGLAILYNVIAVPLAVFGLATPLVAAIAMSSSSLVVTLNALRLKAMRLG